MFHEEFNQHLRIKPPQILTAFMAQSVLHHTNRCLQDKINTLQKELDNVNAHLENKIYDLQKLLLNLRFGENGSLRVYACVRVCVCVCVCALLCVPMRTLMLRGSIILALLTTELLPAFGCCITGTALPCQRL